MSYGENCESHFCISQSREEWWTNLQAVKILRNKITARHERVQALADISRSALCCHSNETRAPIANPPNSAQLEGTIYHSHNSHPGPCSSMEMRRGTDRHTNRQTAVATVHFASAPSHEM